ncbi:MAG: p-hydroxybenzoic acid efflux pump subunit AaeA [Chlamydiae bacterium]|nr:p-hydroxybenzoic acid efflux pump subunit AaeA [Chlamydiota bacterium]
MKDKLPNSRQTFWIIAVLLVTAFIVLLTLVFSSKTGKIEPELKPKLVRTILAKRTDKKVVVSAFGTVQANREVTIRSEVSGRVVFQSKNLVVGGLVQKDDILLRLDARDYLNALEQEKAAVERARFELEVEEGRQVVAKREWEQLKTSIKASEISEDLVLRKPHIREKKAALSAAESKLEKAKLDLSRVVIRSPMNGIVITEAVEIGDYITPQSEIARIVATDEFRVQVSVPVSKLKWIQIPQDNREDGISVRIVQDVGGMHIAREGKILRLLGNLDPSGRMARLLVAIEDPLGLKDPKSRDFPLLIGSYIYVEIDGPILKDIFVLPRETLRENEKVWIKNAQDQLEIRKVNIVQKQEEFVYIDEGLSDGEEVVISNLPLPIPGMELRTLIDTRPPEVEE